jgi:hypothetical protein
MNSYEEGKKVRRISAVIFLIIMAVVVGGSYIAQLEKESAEKDTQVQIIPDKEQVIFFQ